MYFFVLFGVTMKRQIKVSATVPMVAGYLFDVKINNRPTPLSELRLGFL